MSGKLGAILVEQEVITADQLDVALREQARMGGRLGAVLCDLGLTSETEIARAIARQAGVAVATIDEQSIDPEALDLIPEALARKHLVVPLEIVGSQLRVAMANPTDVVAIDELRRHTERFVSVVGAPESQIMRALNHAYRRHNPSRLYREAGTANIHGVIEHAVEAVKGEGSREEGVIELVTRLIEMAVQLGATDLHFEPDAGVMRVRLRIDGELNRGPALPAPLAQPVVARIKIMAGLNIAESRLPQDGKIRHGTGSGEIDLRVSTFPTIFGESVVIRILDQSRALVSLEELGLSEPQAAVLQRAIEHPNGLILVTGPTGGGKTTSLYALLRCISAATRKVITLEDPVEYRLPQTTQCQINERAGVSFATGLRAVLRHDPDVILVGEMRDQETASIAVRAALTGHLVLSTLHTNSALHTLARLRDLEVDSYLIGSCLLAVVAQRLVRLLCEDCRTEYTPRPEELEALGIRKGGSWRQAEGCAACNRRGVRGRSALFEVLEISHELRALIVAEADEAALLEAARRTGFQSLREAAIAKARAGEISLQEIARVSAEA